MGHTVLIANTRDRRTQFLIERPSALEGDAAVRQEFYGALEQAAETLVPVRA